MAERTVTVASAVGLHARPAAIFAEAAAQAGLPVTLTDEHGKAVNAASILGVLSLGVAHGQRVTLSAVGEDAEAVVAALADLLARDLEKAP